MCALLIDALVLTGLVMALNQDSDSPGYGKALAAAFAIGILTFAASMVMSPLGAWGLALIIPAAAAAAGLVLWLVFDVAPLRAVIGGAIYLGYKIVLAIVFIGMFSK